MDRKIDALSYLPTGTKP